jgi:hypothetical protein
MYPLCTHNYLQLSGLMGEDNEKKHRNVVGAFQIVVDV